jgi:hypothetical protein
MFALGRNFLALEIGKPIDAGVSAHHQAVIQETDGLAQIHPFVTRGAQDIWRQMITADELDGAIRHVLV